MSRRSGAAFILEAMELIPTVTADGRIIFRVVTLSPGERVRRFVRKLRRR